MDLARLRHAYVSRGLEREDLDPDPLVEFRRWFDDAVAAGYWEPEAMVLSTVDADGWPAARNVLLRGLDEHGFAFYSNYRSAKAAELDANPRAALTFSWIEIRRQVRVAGTVARVPAEESDAYFAGRPRGSQIGAWASDQSEVIANRQVLDDSQARYEAEFADGPVPRPPHWGGYRLAPVRYEFWQGREDRLHDRFRYTGAADGTGWVIERLSP